MRQRYYADDTGPGGGGDDTTSGGTGDDTTVGSGGGEKTFSQADLDRIIAARLNKSNDANRELLATLTAAQEQLGNHEALKEEVERLKKRTLTQEELEREAREKAEAELSEKLTATTVERDTWRSQFENQFVASELRSAMAKHGVDPAMSNMAETYLRTLSTTSYSDNKPQLTLKIASVDADRKPVVLDLTPDEAVKHLKDGGTMANLFLAGNRSGLGGSGARDTGLNDPMKLTMEEYAKLPLDQRMG